MRKVFVTVAFTLAFSASASNVLWNDGFSMSHGGQFSEQAWALCWNRPEAAGNLAESLYPMIEMIVTTEAGEARVSAVEEVTVGYGYQWVKLEEGETVSADTTRNLDRYYQKGWIDWSPGETTDGIGKSDYDIQPGGRGVYTRLLVDNADPQQHNFLMELVDYPAGLRAINQAQTAQPPPSSPGGHTGSG